MPADFYKRTNYVLTAVTLVVLGGAVLWMARVILLLFFAAVLFSILLCWVVEQVMRLTKLPRVWALVSVVAGTVIVAALAVWARGPAVVEQFGELASSIPAASRQIWSEISRQSWAVWLTSGVGPTGQAYGSIAFLLGKMGSAFMGTATILLGSVVVIFATLYLSAEPEMYLRTLLLVVPVDHRERVREALEAVTVTLRAWLVAKVVSMLSIWIFVSLGLWILKIPLALTLGVVAALMAFVPNIGAVVSVIPAGLLAFAISPGKGIATVVLFALAHFLEGNIVTPIAEREFANLPPALTLAVQLVLAILTGGIGVALAAPLTAAALSLLRFINLEAPGTTVRRSRASDLVEVSQAL